MTDLEKQGLNLYDESLQQFDVVPAMVLDDVDKGSALWKRISAHLDKTLDNLRIANDKQLSEVETAKIRGMIEQVKEFQAIGEDQRPEQPDAPDLGY